MHLPHGGTYNGSGNYTSPARMFFQLFAVLFSDYAGSADGEECLRFVRRRNWKIQRMKSVIWHWQKG